MEQVLASGGGGEDVSARVTALLAGSSLTTSKGVAKGEGREIETVEYEGGERIIIYQTVERRYKNIRLPSPSSQQIWPV